jgi:hypothetical protein
VNRTFGTAPRSRYGRISSWREGVAGIASVASVASSFVDILSACSILMKFCLYLSTRF